MSIKSFGELLLGAMPIISEVAPVLAKAVGGKYEVAIAFMIPKIAQAFAVGINDIGNISNIINNHSDATAKLKTIDSLHADDMHSLMSDVEEVL